MGLYSGPLETGGLELGSTRSQTRIKIRVLCQEEVISLQSSAIVRVAYQAPPSIGFSRQECWSGLPFPSPWDLSDPGIEPGSPTLQADDLPSEPVDKALA